MDCEIEVQLSNEDSLRLEESARERGRFRLNEDEKISDIYDEVYDAVIGRMKEDLREDPTPVQDMLACENEDDDDESIYDEPVTDEQIDEYLDELEIGINYPVDLQWL